MQSLDIFCLAGMLVFCTFLGTVFLLQKEEKEKEEKMKTLIKRNEELNNEASFLRQPVDKLKDGFEGECEKRLTVLHEEHALKTIALNEEHKAAIEDLTEQQAKKLASLHNHISSMEAKLLVADEQTAQLEETIVSNAKEKSRLENDLKSLKERRDNQALRLKQQYDGHLKVMRQNYHQEITKLKEQYQGNIEVKTQEIAAFECQIGDQSNKILQDEKKLRLLKQEFQRNQDDLLQQLKVSKIEKEEEAAISDELFEKLENCQNVLQKHSEVLAAFDSGSLKIEVLKDRTYRMVRNLEFLRNENGKLDTLLGPEVEFVQIPISVDLFRPSGKIVRDADSRKLMECYDGPEAFKIWTQYAFAIRDLERKREEPTESLALPPPSLEKLLEMKKAMTYAEIANQTGIPVGTLKRRINAVRKEQANQE